MQRTVSSFLLPMSTTRTTRAGNAADTNVAADARPARKRCAAATEDDMVQCGGDAAWSSKRRRTTAPVKMTLPDAMLVADIDGCAAPAAAGGDLQPATRTTTATRAARAKSARIPKTPGREWRATPLDFDAPAASLPLPPRGMPAPNFDWPATPLDLDWPPQSTMTPLGRAPPSASADPLCADCDPAYADDDANVDPMLVATYEDNTQLQVDPARVAEAPLERPGRDTPVLRSNTNNLAPAVDCGPVDDAESVPANVPMQVHEDDDRKPHVLLHENLDVVPAPQRLDGWESPVPVILGAHAPPLIVVPYAPRGAGNVNLVLALEDDERKPYVPFHEKLGFITAWQRGVAQSDLPGSSRNGTAPGAYYRPDASGGIPVGDPRTRDWVLLPPQQQPYDVPPMSPKTMQGFAEFLAQQPADAYAWAVPSVFDDGGPRARVEMGLLTPEDEAQGAGAVDPVLLNQLLLDLQAQR